METRWIVDIT